MDKLSIVNDTLAEYPFAVCYGKYVMRMLEKREEPILIFKSLFRDELENSQGK